MNKNINVAKYMSLNKFWIFPIIECMILLKLLNTPFNVSRCEFNLHLSVCIRTQTLHSYKLLNKRITLTIIFPIKYYNQKILTFRQIREH